jgi:hypothetical protein
MTPAREEYIDLINNVNSNMCRGCNKIAVRNGKFSCYFNDNPIGFWNDLLNGENVIKGKGE